MRNKEKYELFIALVAVIISISAFKEELNKISLDLGFVSFSLSDYFLVLILIFVFGLHLYFLPILVGNTKYSNLKILKYFEIGAYSILILALVSPSILLIIWIISYLSNLLNAISKNILEMMQYVLQVLVIISTIILIVLQSFLIFTQRKKAKIEEIENEKIKDLELARKLFKDGYYSQSILESDKVIENYFRKILLDNDYLSSNSRSNDILNLAEKNGLLDPDKKELIIKIKTMRNAAAHLSVDFTKEQAEQVLTTINDLIKGL